MILLTKKFHFNAAHRYHNPGWSEPKNKAVFGPDHNVHGHNYELEVSLAGPVDPETGYLADLGDVRDIVNERVIDVLDHSQIEEDIPWFASRQPTSEHLVMYIWEQLADRFPAGVQLVRVRLNESPTIFAEYDGSGPGAVAPEGPLEA